MKIKLAIEFLDYIVTIASENYNEESIEKKKQVIDLLKRGKKYEKMWKAFKKDTNVSFPTMQYMDNFEQNFPKG